MLIAVFLGIILLGSVEDRFYALQKILPQFLFEVTTLPSLKQTLSKLESEMDYTQNISRCELLNFQNEAVFCLFGLKIPRD
jgi:hypothetical protein